MAANLQIIDLEQGWEEEIQKKVCVRRDVAVVTGDFLLTDSLSFRPSIS